MSSITSALTELWTDWCEVTGTPPEDRDESVLSRFARQAGPSQRLLASLRAEVAKAEPRVTAWPAAHRADSAALGSLLREGAARINNPATFWIGRLRLRRLMFAGVLLAPIHQGGLGLTREQALGLTPASFKELRTGIGTSEEEVACPACAVWAWLEVLGTNTGWASAAVRSLAHRRDEPAGVHRHSLQDTSPEWSDWPDCPNLLPAIDRWGYLDLYTSMHRSSLSLLIGTMPWLLEDAPIDQPKEIQQPTASVPHISPEKEAEVFARADELNARVSAILAEFG